MPIYRADEIKFDDELEPTGGQIVSADQIRFDDEVEAERWSAQQSQPVNMLPERLDVSAGPDVAGLQNLRSTPVAPGMPTEPPRGGTVATGLKELAEIPVDVARSLPAAGAQTGRSLTGLAEAVTDITGDPGGIVKYAKDYWQRELEATTPEKPSLAFKAGQNIFANVPAMATSIVTGNPALSLTWMGATSAGDRRAELRDKGYSPAAATALSVPHGLAEAIGEKLPLDVLMKPAISYGSRALTATALDILGENVTTALQDGLQKVSDRPDMTLSDFLSDLWETTKVSAVSGPVMAGAAQLTHAAADTSTRTDQTIARIQKKLGITPPGEAGVPPVSATPAIGPTGQPEVVGGQIQAPVQPGEEAAAPTVEHRFSTQLRQEYDTLIERGELGQAFDLAYKDNLTGVYNQNGWVRLKSAANEDPDVSVAASDMSGLKYINDTYGHAAGDEVIKAYAESISSKGGMVFRSGKGDELTIIHENSGHLEQLMQAAKEELRKKEFHFQTPSGTIKVKGLDLDYGISHTDKQADEALYAKRAELEKTGQRNPVRGGKPFGLEETPATEGPVEQPQPETAEVTPQQPATATPESPITKEPQLEHNREEVEKSEAKEILGETAVSSKKMKTGLLADIDKAITTAPDTSEEIKKLNAERQKDIRNDRSTGPISESKPYPTPWGKVKKSKRAPQAAPSRPETPTKPPHWSEKYFKKGEQPGGKTEPTKAGEGRTTKTQYSFSPGSNYEGYRQGGEAVPEGTEKEKPLRREPVIQNLMKNLETALYEGRVKVKKAAGFYKGQKEEVRTRKKSDLETIAHEVAHMLDERIPDIRAEYESNDTFNAELKSVSYDKKSTSEGFAEFVRHWMTNKTVAAEKTPEFNAWFNEFLGTSKYGPALIEAQKGMHEWFEQGEIKKLASKIGEQSPINEILSSIGDEIRQSIADDLHGVYKMEREQTGKLSPVGAYETARLARAAYAIADGAVRFGHPVVKPNGDHVFRGKGLKDILKPVSKNLDNWTYYAVARSANELFQQGREHLFTPSEIQAGLSLETPEFRKVFDEYQIWNKGILDFAEAKGLINPANRALWRRLEYLPFKREGQRGTGRKKGGIEGNWSGIRMLTGGTGNIRDVLLNMTSNAANLISESLKNEARVKIADLADKTKGGARFMTRIPKDTRPVTVDKEQVRQFIYETLGISKADVDAGNVPEATIKYIADMEKSLAEKPDFLVFWQMGQAPKGENVVAVLRGGEPDFYEVADPILYRSIASLNRAPKNWMVKFLGSIKHVGQSSITLSVDFMTANIARDTVSGGIMSRSGFRPFIDSLRGMKSRIVNDQDYKDFIANGGGLASYMIEESGLRKHLEKFYSKKGIDYRTVIDTPAKVLYFLEEITDAFEVSTRIGEFKRAREKGASARHAAYLAREVSTDFAMRGDSEIAGFFYDTVMFLKAGVNGMDRLYRGFAHDPQRGRIAAKTGMLALISAALFMLNKDNDEYKDLPDWDKDNHWHFFIGGKHFRYPKIWEIGAVASISERTMEQLFDKDATFKKYPQDVFRITTNLFKISLIPQLLAPMYEQATNRRGFTGVPIEPLWMEGLQPWVRASPFQHRVIQDFGLAERDWPRGLQVSPARIEALLHGYFNTWALYGLTIADAVLYDDIPDLRVDSYPGFRRFYAEKPMKHTKYEEMFYDMLRDATELRRTMRTMEKNEFTQDIAAELEAEYYEKVESPRRLNIINKRISGIRKETIAVIRDPDLTSEEKRKRIDELTEEKNETLKEAVLEMKK